MRIKPGISIEQLKDIIRHSYDLTLKYSITNTCIDRLTAQAEEEYVFNMISYNPELILIVLNKNDFKSDYVLCELEYTDHLNSIAYVKLYLPKAILE